MPIACSEYAMSCCAKGQSDQGRGGGLMTTRIRTIDVLRGLIAVFAVSPLGCAGTDHDPTQADAHDAKVDINVVPENDASTDRRDNPDVDTRDALPSSDRASETGDASSETSDVASETGDVVSETSDVVVAERDVVSETSDVLSETGDVISEAGDGGCACVPPKTGTVTIPLHCYCVAGCLSIDDTTVCVALPPSGQVVMDTYECNIIGITRATGGPSYTWFYDATTKELIGARTLWAMHGDSRTCRTNPDPPLFDLNILAGTIPTCAVATSRTVCRGGDGGDGRDGSSDGEVATDAPNDRDATFDGGDASHDREPDADGVD
jgi:hypothetical protein